MEEKNDFWCSVALRSDCNECYKENGRCIADEKLDVKCNGCDFTYGTCENCQIRKEEEMEKSKVMTLIKFKDGFRFVFPEVKEMFYVAEKESGEEYVLVHAASTVNHKFLGEGPVYDFKINVTADSNMAMIDDVWKELKRRFA